ncbi:MAG TPA: asparagine synthase (glutamine-hydrolyzing) [Acidobacteriota bacterium]|nr:asparagine synthase (glutamine-hydrolyzing) [Acidobacteriota bacterium]
MCGIAGIFHHDREKPVDRQTLTAMAAIQHHRGPDGFGVEVMPGVGFSHARLAIIDLCETGNQPLVSQDGRMMLTHNGEFYDFQRLRADMTSRGERFHTKTDSGLALALYRRFGLARTLEELRGEFAFGLYDSQDDHLLLVRDRFGIKPLYWTRTADSLVFGSEIKVLFAHPEVKRNFSSQGVFHQLMQTIVPGSTPFEDVHQVQPGHVLSIKRRDGRLNIREYPYWDMEFPPLNEQARGRSEEDCIESVRAKLLEAVQLRLVADVPVGCYLSGGIDSCSILGLAAAVRQDPVKAFTIGFDNADYDESPIAREMAESVGAEQDILRLDSSHLYDHFVETHWHTERTIYNTLGVAKLLMSRHVHETGYKVVVTGEGSDELFAGYPSFRRDMFLHGLEHMPEDERRQWRRMLAESNQLVKGAMLAAEEFHDEALDELCGFTPACLQPWLDASRRVPAILSGDLRSQLEDYQPGRAIAEQIDPEAIKGRHPLDIAQYVWIKTQLEGQILTWGGDRVDMANSMEARPAFLDHHLAEEAARIPPSYRIKGRIEKYVLREAMKGLLPKVLYEREKFAFMAPPAHTSEDEEEAFRTLLDTYLSDEAVKDSGLLDPQGVKEVFDVHDSPDSSHSTLVQLDALINHMLGVQILDRDFVEADLPARARKTADQLGWTVEKSDPLEPVASH